MKKSLKISFSLAKVNLKLDRVDMLIDYKNCLLYTSDAADE